MATNGNKEESCDLLYSRHITGDLNTGVSGEVSRLPGSPLLAFGQESFQNPNLLVAFPVINRIALCFNMQVYCSAIKYKLSDGNNFKIVDIPIFPSDIEITSKTHVHTTHDK